MIEFLMVSFGSFILLMLIIIFGFWEIENLKSSTRWYLLGGWVVINLTEFTIYISSKFIH